MKGFKVMRHEYTETASGVTVTQCGGVCKTGEKAFNLKARMRAQQPLGSSVWFTITAAE